MKQASSRLVGLFLAASLAACGGGNHGHDHDHDHEDPLSDETHGEEDHEHAEDPLGTVQIGEYEVELSQGHGAVAAGEEVHLVVRLPYSDSGSTIVRAWIGTEDRTLSYVGKGEYAESHDDYDVHATAPDPLPENPMWWVEIEKPDGTKLVGSAEPIL